MAHINTVKHGSVLLLLLLHLSLCEAQLGEDFNVQCWKQKPKLAVTQIVALWSLDTWLRHLPVTDHSAF